MADYYTPTVVQQNIPKIDMTPLDWLLLEQIFDSHEPNEDELYFYAEIAPNDSIALDRRKLESAIAASPHPSAVDEIIGEQLLDSDPAETDITLDLSGISWEFLLQEIVRRSTTLRYVTVLSSFTCSKMRSDAWGGMAVLITADAILGKSTTDILEDFLVEAGLDQIESAPSAKDEAGHA